jgi:hypothetical protein
MLRTEVLEFPCISSMYTLHLVFYTDACLMAGAPRQMWIRLLFFIERNDFSNIRSAWLEKGILVRL